MAKKKRSLKRRMAAAGRLSSSQPKSVRDDRHGAIEFVAKVTKMPDFKVTELGNGKIGIECPKPTCKGKAVLNRKIWLLRDTDHLTRACSYCGMWYLIPLDLLPKKDPRK